MRYYILFYGMSIMFCAIISATHSSNKKPQSKVGNPTLEKAMAYLINHQGKANILAHPKKPSEIKKSCMLKKEKLKQD